MYKRYYKYPLSSMPLCFSGCGEGVKEPPGGLSGTQPQGAPSTERARTAGAAGPCRSPTETRAAPEPPSMSVAGSAPSATAPSVCPGPGPSIAPNTPRSGASRTTPRSTPATRLPPSDPAPGNASPPASRGSTSDHRSSCQFEPSPILFDSLNY